jgi:hypothetical protein
MEERKADNYKKNLEVPAIHGEFNPENCSIITHWSWHWSLNSVTYIFPREESNPCSVVGQYEKL